MKWKRGLILLAGMVVLLVAAQGLKVQARGAGVAALGGALLVLWAVLQTNARVGLFARRHFQPDAESARGMDDRRPILYLRSFRADSVDPVRRAGLFGRLFFGRVNVPLEAAVTDLLLEFGPVIAIGRPGEPLPPLGAYRFYAPKDGEEWKRHVAEFARDAQLIVVVLGETPGLRWEYDLLAGSAWLGKTVFVVPPVRGGALEAVFRVFDDYLMAWDLRVRGSIGPDVALFAPGGEGRLTPLHAAGLRRRPPRADDYHRPLRQVLDAAASAPTPRAVPRPDPHGVRNSRPSITAPVRARRVGEPAVDGRELDLDTGGTDADVVVLPKRLQAALIDWFVCTLLVMLVTVPATTASDPAALQHPVGSPEEKEQTRTAGAIAMTVSPLLVFLLEGVLGLSLGKRWFGLRVLTRDGRRPAWSRRVRRTAVKAVSMFVCLVPFAILAAVIGDAWHDRLARTKVVAVPKGR